MESTDPGRAVLEDLVRAALPELVDTSRQSDPAESTPPPEGGTADARGWVGAAGAAPTVAALDLGAAEPTARYAGAFLTYALGVVTLLAAAIAYADPGPVTIGLLVALAGGVAVAARLRARHRTVVTVTAAGSRLEIVRDGSRHVFDLAGPNPVDVVGRPGEPGWRVLFHRRGMAPYELDGAHVDAQELMRVLTAHRPEVRYRPR